MFTADISKSRTREGTADATYKSSKSVSEFDSDYRNDHYNQKGDHHYNERRQKNTKIYSPIFVSTTTEKKS